MSALIEQLVEEIEPMDWHNLRFLDYLPKHFVRCKMDKPAPEVLQWVERHTTGRFAIAPDTQLAQRHNYFVRQDMVIGFENPMDATLYTLSHR